MINKDKYNKIWTNQYSAMVLGLTLAICMKFCLNTGASELGYTNSFVSALVWGCYVGFLSYLKKQKLWESMYPVLKKSFFFTALFFSAILMGVQLDKWGNVDFASWEWYVAIVILTVCCTPICAWALYNLEQKNITIMTRVSLGGAQPCKAVGSAVFSVCDYTACRVARFFYI